MISVVQRVRSAAVEVDGDRVGAIECGLLALVCALRGDGVEDVEYTARRLLTLRIFPDDEGRMNRSVQEVGGSLLIVSQFTLAGDTRKGRRPSYTDAAAPAHAEPLYERFASRLAARGLTVARGVFGAMMDVELVNDGPVTILLEPPQGTR